MTDYRGKYPNRVKGISYMNKILIVYLNDGHCRKFFGEEIKKISDGFGGKFPPIGTEYESVLAKVY